MHLKSRCPVAITRKSSIADNNWWRHLAKLTKHNVIWRHWCRHRANSTKHYVVFNFCPLAITWKHDVIHNTGSRLRIVLSSEDWATAPGNMYGNQVKFGHVFLDMQKDKKTHRHADRNTLRNYRGNVMMR